MLSESLTRQTKELGLWGIFWRHFRLHRIIGTGLLLSLLAILYLFIQSLVVLMAGQGSAGLSFALMGSAASFGMTVLGALPVLLLRALSARVEDTALGAAAGMMLAASAFSLLLPGIEAGATILNHKLLGAGLVVMGMLLGALLMLGLDAFMPHEHAGNVHGPQTDRLSGVWLFVFAIILHNLPEGMAIGVAFSQADLAVGIPLTTAIALQNVPEGLAVGLALKSAGLGARPAFWVAALSGAMEPLGAVLGVGLSTGFPEAYPIGLGLAAGAMIFVVSHEVIPQTHKNGHQTAATLGLLLGFALMMVLDTTLG